MPRSIIWLDRLNGKVELIPPELKVLGLTRGADGRSKSTVAVTTETNVNQDMNRIGYQALRTVVARCGELLTWIQATQRTGQDLEGARSNAEIAELRECVTQLNQDFARERRVSYNVVRAAMTVELGVAGRFWTKLEPDGRKTILWYHETSGETELVLKKAGERVASVKGDQTSSTSGQVELELEPPKDDGRAQAVQKLRNLLGRCRVCLEDVHEKEKSSQSTHRGQRELLAGPTQSGRDSKQGQCESGE